MKRLKNLIIFLIFFSIPCFVGPQDLLHGALSTKNEIPELSQVHYWFNTKIPLTKKNLSGKVVLIDFWSYTDRRSIRRIQQVITHWHTNYQFDSFEIIGVLTPQFLFEKNPKTVSKILQNLKIYYPVVLDDASNLWHVFNPPAQPFSFLVDGEGRVREKLAETFDLNKTELQILELIRKAAPDAALIASEKIHLPAYEDFPDFYFGYKKLTGYGNDQKMTAETAQVFSFPAQFFPQHFYLKGTWKSKEESLQLTGPPASLILPHEARGVYLVAGSVTSAPIPAEIRLDGQPLTKQIKGKDIVLQEGKSYLFVKDYRLYEILKLPEKRGPYQLEMIFEDPGVEIFKASFE